MGPTRARKVVDFADCPFCVIARGCDPHVREVARNETVVIFFPTEPAVLGHCMVIPRRHVEEFAALTREEVSELMLAAQTVDKSIRDAWHPDGTNLIQSNGDAASQSVPHVHVHVVPRWNDDAIGEIWPAESSYTENAKNGALAKLRATTSLSGTPPNSEDKRQHLAFTQAIIARMAQSSGNAKSWLLPVVTATYGYAITKSSSIIALLGIIATLIFGFLDIGYLRTERKYRDLYDRIAAGDPSIPPFSLNHNDSQSHPLHTALEYISVMKTWAVWPFYGVLLATGLVIVALTA